MEATQNIKFIKTLGKWTVTGPAELVTEGATVNVVKADGTTVSVYIRSTTIRGGILVAQFTEAATRDAQIAHEAAQEAHWAAGLLAHNLKVIAMSAETEARYAAKESN